MKELRTIRGKAWSGLWKGRSHNLGWLLGHFLVHGRTEPLTEEQKESLSGKRPSRFAHSDFYRVEVTIRPLKDKRGKYIVRRAKKVKV